jgi:hypothetical protein
MSRFQDRKLNKCRVCFTQKELAIHFDINDKAYFLCKPHTLLNDLLVDKMRKLEPTEPLKCK